MVGRKLWFVGVWFISLGLSAGEVKVVAETELVAVGPIQPAKLAVRPGSGGRVTFHWTARPLAKDYQVFVHCTDAVGRIAFQADHGPAVPTSGWNGKVEYARTIWVPAGTAEGEYQIWIGLYDPQAVDTGWDRQRLRAEAGAELDADAAGGASQRCRVGTLTVDSRAPLPELPAPSLDLSGYHLTFSEEFDQLSVTSGKDGHPEARWLSHMPNCPDFGDAKFADPTPDFPFTVREGILAITARRDATGWKAGLLSSMNEAGQGFSQQYGYFEMRAKFPAAAGMWPAFWLLGANSFKDLISPTKTAGYPEIDVVEHYSAMLNAIHTTLHIWGPAKRHTADVDLLVGAGLTEDFHTYGVLVSETDLIWYLDGRELRRLPTPAEVKVPLYILLDLAVGGGWPVEAASSPSQMLVDYVRAYAKN